MSTHLLAKHALDIDDFTTEIEESACFIKQTFLHDIFSFSITE